MLWSEPYLEFQLLAAMLLGQIDPNPTKSYHPEAEFLDKSKSGILPDRGRDGEFFQPNPKRTAQSNDPVNPGLVRGKGPVSPPDRTAGTAAVHRRAGIPEYPGVLPPDPTPRLQRTIGITAGFT